MGHRISSKRATPFRQWAAQTLKQILVQGYAINRKRLQEKGVEFSQAVGFWGYFVIAKILENSTACFSVYLKIDAFSI